ncbi:glutamine synthetase family protein [Mycolicibacterium monacense]|uniref:Glutamate--ammonia ligase n=3 Tax=Mycobacteriaceae TaxID=1762 RepID=A0AAD1MXD0_MYCMB|nr:glutamine synthetase family protein [Mycolicibacterium monacense]MDA4100546.1 glutamate--ammonia ligase [Mycolicibacterium monacense DSM 44395]OBB71378.1 glutamine synthetase [Mycolicibacterium monacense]OBF51553.1 glutamine synthetase [Mycolicibacterium monacense]ORB23979.1 glutamine synthetase [Mycolicibacterium monacense DSM 44395]QHP85755.1 glutamine synthetase [Mycolicibacterium monacense DSM 44395]
MGTRTGMLAQADLERMVSEREIDTVIVAFTDMQGRLTGKRISARLFVDDVAAHGAECCNYLLAVDVDNNTVGGYAISSWETGYGDMVMTPDFDTLRLLPWLPGTALVMADLSWTDGRPVTQAPRSILNRQIDRLAERDLVPYASTELEFMVFDDSFRAAWAAGYRGLTAATDYNIDYAMLASTRMEPLLRDIRLGMEGAGMYCEGVKGECNLGQQEIGFRYDHARVTCDNHTIYKNGAKEIADQHGKSLTFMAKFDEREGNSCHIHISLRGSDGSTVFADEDAEDGMTPLFRSFIAGQIATMREFSLCYAPNINSYKRFAEGSFAPTAIAWGFDNRTCALRVVGQGAGMRMENRAPGGDVNQYLAVSALIAGGLYGIENELELPDPVKGNAYTSGAERLPTTLSEAAELFDRSEIAREAFGDDVVDHYLNYARVELNAFNAAVTDWERVRGFERL